MNSTTHYSTLTSPWLNLLNSVTWSIIKTLPHRRWSACKIISSGLCIFRMMITIGYRCQSSSWSWSDSRSSAPCVYLISWPWPRLSRPDLVPSFEKLILIYIRVNTHRHTDTWGILSSCPGRLQWPWMIGDVQELSIWCPLTVSLWSDSDNYKELSVNSLVSSHCCIPIKFSQKLI